MAKSRCATAGIVAGMLILAAAAAMIGVADGVDCRLYGAGVRRRCVERRVMGQNGDQQNDQSHCMRQGSPKEGPPYAGDTRFSAHVCFLDTWRH